MVYDLSQQTKLDESFLERTITGDKNGHTVMNPKLSDSLWQKSTSSPRLKKAHEMR